MSDKKRTGIHKGWFSLLVGLIFIRYWMIGVRAIALSFRLLKGVVKKIPFMVSLFMNKTES